MPNYNDISAGGEARQHNGDSYNYSTNYYPLRQRRSDDKLREDTRNRALLQAAAEGQSIRVNKLLKDGADVDFVDKYGWTALHHAAYSGFEDTAQDLLAAGADVNARSEHFGTPLALAAVKGRFNVAKKLLESRASIRTPCGNLGSISHAACAGGNVELIQALIDLGADMTTRRRFEKTFIDMLIGPQDVGNYLDFELAVESASEHSRESTPDPEGGRVSLSHDGTVVLDGMQYTSAINVAALYGDRDALLRFLHCKVGDVDKGIVVNTLNYTAAFGQTKTLALFQHSFLPLDCTRSPTAVLAAACTGNYACLKFLRDNGASARPIGERDMTALLLAAKHGHFSCVELLTDRDHPDRDWTNFEFHEVTPLMAAAGRGHLDCVRVLLRKGASIEGRNGSGENALHCAARYGHVIIIEELVQAGINVNCLDNDGWTPLMCSLYDFEWGYGEVFRPRRYVIEKLIALGADPNIKNIARLLEEKGWKDAVSWLERKELRIRNAKCEMK